MRTKVLPVVLAPKLYAELERQARSQERDPLQQARFLIKQALQAGAPSDPPAELPPGHTTAVRLETKPAGAPGVT
jgi:hypothetical protein